MFCNVILVNWNRAIDTCSCIDSLEQTVGVKWYAIICENGSSDNSNIELRRFLAERYIERIRVNTELDIFDYFNANDLNVPPRVTLALSPSNLGFAGGCNFACRHAFPSKEADYVWFLNNDTEVEPDTLYRIIERISQDPSIGVCGCTVIYAHDKKTVQVCGGATYQPWTGIIREIGRGKTWPFKVDVSEVEARMSYVYGASMLVTSECFRQVAPMCEDYFLYYEEIDWAERARRAGFRLGYAPLALVYHKEGSALGSGKSASRSMLSEYYGISGRLIVTRRYFSWALPSVYLFSLLQILRRCLQGYWPRARMMAAVLFGLRRTPPEG
ncbi:MAG: glycosyltransferase family 2 protein [Betaproteobacteria bacterium]|nr:glycosyltransferase family 2 protein [Betaproteobacteria bacterium]